MCQGAFRVLGLSFAKGEIQEKRKFLAALDRLRGSAILTRSRITRTRQVKPSFNELHNDLWSLNSTKPSLLYQYRNLILGNALVPALAIAPYASNEGRVWTVVNCIIHVYMRVYRRLAEYSSLARSKQAFS